MTKSFVLAVVLALGSAAYGSQEEIHGWKSAAIVADTSLFGDVAVKVGADAKGNVESLAVTVKGKTIAIPTKWLQSLPALRLATIEVRSERGYDPQPWLYVVFHVGWTKDDVHIAIQDGRLVNALVTTYDAKGTAKRETRKAP